MFLSACAYCTYCSIKLGNCATYRALCADGNLGGIETLILQHAERTVRKLSLHAPSIGHCQMTLPASSAGLFVAFNSPSICSTSSSSNTSSSVSSSGSESCGSSSSESVGSTERARQRLGVNSFTRVLFFGLGVTLGESVGVTLGVAVLTERRVHCRSSGLHLSVAAVGAMAWWSRHCRWTVAGLFTGCRIAPSLRLWMYQVASQSCIT